MELKVIKYRNIGSVEDKYVYELINGNCEKVISNFSHLNTLYSVKNFLQPKIVSKTTQQ